MRSFISIITALMLCTLSACAKKNINHHELTVTKVHRMMENKQLTSEELVNYHLADRPCFKYC